MLDVSIKIHEKKFSRDKIHFSDKNETFKDFKTCSDFHLSEALIHSFLIFL